MKYKQKIDGLIVSCLIGALPVSMLSIGHTSAIFYSLLVICLTICFSRIGGFSATKQDWFRYRWLAIGLFSMAFFVMIAMLLEHRFLGSAVERALRIGLGIFIVLGACFSLRPLWLRQAIWGIGLATIVSSAIVWWLVWPHLSRPQTPEFNAVSFGNLTLLVSILTVFSLGWKLTTFKKTETLIKILMFVFGLSGFILTQTRSGWLAVPLFVLIGVLLFKDKYKPVKLVSCFVLGTTFMAAAFFTHPILVDRTKRGIDEFKECIANPISDANVCVRLQLWRASWEMFKQDPWLGNGGGDRFEGELILLVDKKVVSKSVAEQGFGEPHNDMLYMMASYGILGLIGLVLIYLTPGYIFARRLIGAYSLEVRIAAAMGLVVCIGFLVFGFTELMFRGMRTMSFYAVTTAWLLALSDQAFIARNDIDIAFPS